MDTEERIDERRVVVDTPGQRREIVTERTHTARDAREETTISGATIGIVAIIVLVAIGVVVYFVTSNNADQQANLDTAAQIARDQQAAAQVPAPAPQQQAPIVIQQPAPQAPVIVQQPAAAVDTGVTIDDPTMNELATKRLGEDPSLNLVVTMISNGRAVLSGSVNTAADKARAEQIVRAVRGVKSVDNRITVSNP
ncbi:MAG: BON domain-containing protein [Acidobacteriota bacterium]